MFECTKVADDGNLCGESPRWDASASRLYWVDCVGNKVYRMDWGDRRSRVILEGMQVSALALEEDGGLLLAGSSGVWLWDQEAAPLQLVGELNGVPLSINDCIADPRGRLLAGTAFYDPAGGYRLGDLVCIDCDLTVKVLDTGFHLANGMGFSPDTKTLYCADSILRRIYAYRYDAESGTVSGRRLFAQLPLDAGLPDGLTVDAQGFVWVAEWYGSRVSRYSPEGQLETHAALPVSQVSSLTFGGPRMDRLFVTTAGKLELTPVMPIGYDADAHVCGGALYEFQAGGVGKVDFRTSLR